MVQNIVIICAVIVAARIVYVIAEPGAKKFAARMRKKLLLKNLLVTEKDIRTYMKVKWPQLNQFCRGPLSSYYISYSAKYAIRIRKSDVCREFHSVFYHSEKMKKSEMNPQYGFACPVNEVDDHLAVDILAHEFVNAMTVNIPWSFMNYPEANSGQEVLFRDYFLTKFGHDLMELGTEVNRCDGCKNPAFKILSNSSGESRAMMQNFHIMVRLDWIMRLIYYYTINSYSYIVDEPSVRKLLNLGGYEKHERRKPNEQS